MRELSKVGYVAAGDKFVAMRGGRTNKVWKFGNHHESKVLKLYRPVDTNPLFDNDPRSEITCLTALDGAELAPRLLSHGSHSLGHWIIYEHVNGLAWRHDPTPVANLLACVHGQTPLTELRFGINGSAEIERQTLGILSQCHPDNRDRIIDNTPNWHISPIDHLCLIHGDPVPGNIVLTDKTPVLIDWQCPKNGDPTEDIALFLSPAMQKLYRGTPLTLTEEHAFLTAYPNPNITQRYQNLKAWYHWRMAAYCLWRMDQGENDYAAGFDLEYNSLNACTAPH